MKLEELKTIDELALILKVRKGWLYGQTFRTGPGSIPRLKIGKHLRFDMGEIEKWILKKNER